MNEEEEMPESEDKKIPRFLKLTYLLILIWGLWAFFAYWNGPPGWPDRRDWQGLQKAANTTFPFEKKEPYLKALEPSSD